MQMVAAAFTQEHADGQEAASFVLLVALLQLHRRRLLQACFVSANKLQSFSLCFDYSNIFLLIVILYKLTLFLCSYTCYSAHAINCTVLIIVLLLLQVRSSIKDLKLFSFF